MISKYSGSSDDPLGLVLSRLKNVKKKGIGYLACCPAHDDSKQSLSVDYKNGKVLIHCFAGCSNQRILREIGLGFRDLYPKNTRR